MSKTLRDYANTILLHLKPVFGDLTIWVITSFCGLVIGYVLSLIFLSHPANSPGDLLEIASTSGSSLTCALIMLHTVVQHLIDPLKGEVDPALTASLVWVQLICAMTHFIIAFNWMPVLVNSFGRVVHTARYIQWIAMFPLVASLLEHVDYDHKFSVIDVLLGSAAVLIGSIASILQNRTLAIVLMVISYILGLNCLNTVLRRYRRLTTLRAKGSNSSLSVTEVHKINRAYILSWIFTLDNVFYMLAHCLGLFKFIDCKTENMAFSVADVVLKTLFGAALTHSQSYILNRLDKLKAAHDSGRKFLRYVFHEIRVPLNALNLGIQALQDAEKISSDQNLSEIVGMLGDSTDSMLTVLDDVLSFQKIEDGKFELSLSEFDLKDICQRAIRTFEKQFQAKKITAEIRFDENIPGLIGDRARIRQVIQNLLSNAIKFSNDSSKITVIVQTANLGRHLRSQSICPVSVSVCDTGIGISMEDQAHLFMPFTQIRPGELQDGRGSGLGLSICRQIVEMHKGEIGVVSRVGEGSCFVFTIPFKTKHKHRSTIVGTSRSPSVQKRQQELEQRINLKKPKVLVVDDVKSNRRLLEVALKKMGCEVDCAENGKEALEQVTKCSTNNTGDARSYDMVLLDNVMPKMTGVECAQEIRKKGIGIPIIGVTGNAVQDDVEEFLAAGATQVLTKPVQLRDLIQSLNNFLPTQQKLLDHVK